MGGGVGGARRTAACQRLKHENILSVTYMGLKCRASVLILVHFFFLFFFRICWSGSCHSRRQAGCCGFEAGDHTESNIHSPDNKTIWCFFFFLGGGGGVFLNHRGPTRSETSGVAEEKQQLCSSIRLEFSCTFILRRRAELLNIF